MLLGFNVKTLGAIPIDSCAMPYENKAKSVRDPPLRYYLEMALRVLRGILHWASKIMSLWCLVRSARKIQGRLIRDLDKKFKRHVILVANRTQPRSALRSSGGSKGGRHLKGGHLKLGFRSDSAFAKRGACKRGLRKLGHWTY